MNKALKSVYFVVGARPQFIKAAPVLESMKKYPEISVKLIHTGQHYDYNLSQLFFDELNLPVPHYQLNCGSGNSIQQYCTILERLGEVLENDRPDLIVVFGDTNSTGAAALCAILKKIKLAHIEAGLREFDKQIPEEINKMVTDSLSDLYFCPTQTGVNFLTAANVSGRIILSGDPVLDLIHHGRDKFDRSIFTQLELKAGNFIFATIHRQNNTMDVNSLTAILELFAEAPFPIVLPLHPRTRQAIDLHGLDRFLNHPNIRIIDPVGFWQTQALIDGCTLVMTDSGGVIKEAYFHGKYVMILDKQTEWVEVVNEKKGMIWRADQKFSFERFSNEASTPSLSLGNGNASEIIAQGIADFLRE